MSEFKDFLNYVEQYPSIDVVVVGLSWISLKIFANTFPNIKSCALSDLKDYEFKGPHQLIVVNSDMASPMFFSPVRHQNDYDQFQVLVSHQPKFDATLVFLNPSCSTFCLGAIEGRNIIEQLIDCPIPQSNSVPSVWRTMVDNYANQMQQRRLNEVVEYEINTVPHIKKKI